MQGDRVHQLVSGKWNLPFYARPTKCKEYSLFVDMHELHIHGVYRGEYVGGTLHNALSGLRHGDWSARGQEHGFVAAAKWQEGQVVTLHQYHLQNTKRNHQLSTGYLFNSERC